MALACEKSNLFNKALQYNEEHYHSGIEFLTPQSVHYHQAEAVLEKRYRVLLEAYEENPTRFNNRKPSRKTLRPAYINPPKEKSNENLHEEKNMA